MFLSDEERREMDSADWRFYHYKTKKMDVFAQRGLFVCIVELGLLVPSMLLMHEHNILATVFFVTASAPFMIPFIKTAWWFFDDREELKIWREAKASNPGGLEW